MKPILVQMASREWTMQAVHFACALARSNRTQVILLRLMPVSDIRHLGTSFGNLPPTRQQLAEMWDYTDTAEDYDVNFVIQPMQCMDTQSGLVDATVSLDAGIVFAHVPSRRLPYLQKFQIWMLKRQLSTGQRQVFTLTEPNNAIYHTPAIVHEPIEPIHT